MALTIRLRQQGRRNRTTYRLVVTPKQANRDGKYTEMLGWYDPLIEDKDAQLKIDIERLSFWLEKGAELSENAEALVKRSCPSVLKDLFEKRTQAEIARKRRARERKAAASA